MKKNFVIPFILVLMTSFIFAACNSGPAGEATNAEATPEAVGAGQAAVTDDVSQKDIVKVAMGSPDHTTLVAAVQAADLVNVLANAGPFTVFAPTNAAFDALPEGVVANLLKPENKNDLSDLLQYHVALGVYKQEMFKDGQVINMANSQNITMSVKDGKIMVNGQATIVGSVPASNGLIYVVDAVILPPPAN